MTSINNQTRSWYLVTTKPQSEFKAQENLLRQGYESYLPLVQTSRRRNGKNINRTEAFFPRYLFISLNKETDNWSPIRSTIGVSGMVRFGGMPVVVPENMIDNLKKNENEFGLQSFEKKELKLGDKVGIIDGPFEGYKAIYQKMKSSERVSVLLDIVGKNTQITLSVHELEIA
ncbi:MAG: transcription/translation regulatory transformer protein RfaH [Pseudomonadota bacterium]